MSNNYETLKQAGYEHVKTLGYGKHVLKQSDGKLQLFVCCKNYAGWALIYKNTHLEFCGDYRGGAK